MFTSEDHYFANGANALAIIRRSLDAAGINSASVGRVLDYACGYGRVLRWLKVAFPEAKFLAVDADLPSVDGVRRLGVQARQLDVSLRALLGEPFDLIWVGSLFTHVSQDETVRVLRYLRRHLTPTGVLVFSMDGALVRDNLASGVELYGLGAAEASAIVEGYDAGGYGYADYPDWPGYGISAATPLMMMQTLADCGLMPVLFQACAWDWHQDAYACVGG